MSNHLKVDGHNNLVRDRRTGAILNTNKTEIERARKLKRVSEEREEHINSLTKEVKGLKEDMSQIKQLLLKLAGTTNE
jgi:predicted transcriptional regulator